MFGAYNPNTMFSDDTRVTALVKKLSIILFDVIFIAALVFLAIVAVKAQSSSSLSVNVTLDKYVYEYDEPVNITLEAENTTGSDITLSFSTGCQMGFEIYQFMQSTGDYKLPVYNDTLYPRNCDEVSTSVAIPDGKKAIWTRTFDFENTEYPPLIPGKYILHGFNTDYEDEAWSYQPSSYVTFTVDYGFLEGSLCDDKNFCVSGRTCLYTGVFSETGGVCLSDPQPYDDDNFDELLCAGTGGEYNGECSCPSGYEWSSKVGCSESAARDELCIETGGTITKDTSMPCYCEENKVFNLVQGCIEEPAEGFNDIEGHWAEQFIMALYNKGVVRGYEDGGFHPDSNINRAELTKMALSAAEISAEDPAGETDFLFADLDEWQKGWVYAAWKRGIVQGYDPETFSPAKDVTRAEALKISMLAFERQVPDTSDEWAFSDTVNHWSISYINQAYLDFIVSGREGDLFYPDSQITRAEASKIIQLLSEL